MKVGCRRPLKERHLVPGGGAKKREARGCACDCLMETFPSL